jgi:hypothetical protein
MTRMQSNDSMNTQPRGRSGALGRRLTCSEGHGVRLFMRKDLSPPNGLSMTVPLTPADVIDGWPFSPGNKAHVPPYC